jgi:DNA-binding transcriptional MocR family regulator
VQVRTIDEKPLYLQVADSVAELIAAGSLRAGDRVPSVRRLSGQQKVSVPTVLQAYMVLENRRMIEARPKSGFFVRPRLSESLAEPAVCRKTSTAPWDDFHPSTPIVRDLVDPRLVPLGGAIPSPDLLPGAKLARIVGSLARERTAETISYDPVPGSLTLRREISRRSLDWGCHLSSEEFIVVNGATEGVHLALRAVTKPGDTVLIESPTYYGLVHILNQMGLKAVAVPASAREGLSIEGVERALNRHRIAAITLIPNFNNPLGSVMPEDNRLSLLQLSSKRRIPVIEDDVYGDLQHEGARPRCLKALDKDGLVLLCGSFSKTIAPGYRVGYISPGLFHERIVHLKTAMNWGNATLPALAIAEFLRNGGYDHHLRKIRRTYRDQVQKMREAVAAAFPNPVKISNPRGGFVLWVELPLAVDAMRLFEEARKAGISLAPGPIFSPVGGFSNYIRLSCGFPWSTKIERAIGVLGRLASRLEKEGGSEEPMRDAIASQSI